MFKHKIIKYSLIFLLTLAILILLILFRISVKPLDISLINTHLPQLKSYISEIKNLDAEKIIVKFDIVNNHVNVDLGDVRISEYNRLSNISAEKIIINIKIIEFLKRNFAIDMLSITNGNFDLTQVEGFSREPKEAIFDYFNNSKINSLNFNNINFNIYNKEKKIAFANNINGLIKKKGKENWYTSISAKNIQYFNAIDKNKFSIQNFYLSSQNKESYTISLDKLDISNETSIVNKKYIKNLNNIVVEKIQSNYFLNSNKLQATGNIVLNNKRNPASLIGYYSDNIFNKLNINIKLISLPLFSLFNLPNFKKEKNFSENLSKLIFNGNVNINIDNNELLKAKINIKSTTDNNANFKFIGPDNNVLLNLKEAFIDATIRKNLIEIEQINLISEEGFIALNGNLINIKNDIDYNINLNFKEYNFANFFYITTNFFPEFKRYTNNFNKIKNASIKNFKINFSKKNTVFNIGSLQSELENITFLLDENISIKLPSLEIIKNNNVAYVKSKFIDISNSTNNAFLNDLTINIYNLSNLENITDDLNIITKIKSNYKFLKDTVNLLSLKNQEFIDIDNLQGDIEGFLNIKYNEELNKNNKLSYNFNGNLKNFNYIIKNSNEEAIIRLNDFKGIIISNNSTLDIKGRGLLNDSLSNIDIKLDANSNIIANINSDAKASSFDFLKSYNFIKGGNAKFNMSISKNIDSNDWSAKINANLFSNDIYLDFLEYNKTKNKRAEISGIFYFTDNNLKKIKDLNFHSEDMLANASLFFNDNKEVNKINFKELILNKNNISGHIEINEGYKIIRVLGDSIDLKDFLKSKNNKSKNLILKLDVNRLFYGDLSFGKSSINSTIQNNLISKVEGKVFFKDNPYFTIKNEHNENDILHIILTFDNFGSFLKNSNISDSFIKGSGNITFDLNKNTHEIFNGNVNIIDTSIRNASFLARLLQLASFTGLLEILTNEGIPITKLEGYFQIKDNNLTLKNTKIKGFSLGGNVEGNVSIKTKEIDLSGTIIPAYAINSLINKIPIIGQVITGIEGEGLIGVNYNATGTYENPDYTINPLSILTPGILRSIFDGFLGKEKKDDNTK